MLCYFYSRFSCNSPSVSQKLEEGKVVIGYMDDGGDMNDSDDTIEHGDNEREVFTVNSEENLLDTAMY